MTYKQIETSREIRLWVRDIIVPAVTIAGAMMVAHPEFQEAVVEKFEKAKRSVRERKLKVHEKEES